MKPFDPFEGRPVPPPARPPDWQPLDLLAKLLLSLTYAEMLTFAIDLHSDQETYEPKPIDIADQLYRWAQRTGGKS